jgi:glutamate racemase
VGDRAIVIDVVSLIVEYAAKHFQNQKLGLIGTEYTVGSRVYEKAFVEQAPSIELSSIATPSLIYHIEKEINKLHPKRIEVYDALIQKYLSVESLKNIQALILGCTHYPFVKDRISAYYQYKIPLIDSSVLVAERISRHCEEQSDVAIQCVEIDASARRLDCFGRKFSRKHGGSHFFCTQASEPFAQAVKYFFEQEAELLNF